jgi:hypothetical protein
MNPDLQPIKDKFLGEIKNGNKKLFILAGHEYDDR